MVGPCAVYGPCVGKYYTSNPVQIGKSSRSYYAVLHDKSRHVVCVCVSRPPILESIKKYSSHVLLLHFW